MVVLTITTGSYSQNTQTNKPLGKETTRKIPLRPIGYVNDFEGLLTDEQVKQLTEIIKKHEQQTTDQIAIVTLTSLKPYENIDEFSLNLANQWGVGQKGKNNGVLIAIAAGLGKIRIQNGYGIESRLTDPETKRIIDELIIPEFRSRNYYEGLKKALEAILKN